MQFWVAVTDNDWYQFLAARKPDEVNFWQPSGLPPFKFAPIGMPFLFKLKSPYNHLAGGGYFVTYSQLPLAVAWEVFGDKNGCDSLETLRAMIGSLASPLRVIEQIGCTVLSSPFFFAQSDWLPDPAGWSRNIVRGKTYDTQTSDGRTIWNWWEPRLRFARDSTGSSKFGILDAADDKYAEPVLVRPRLGQSSFRVLLTDAYKRRCAFTGETTLVALEAAHIVPYAGAGTHEISNGLLLRADFHRLFDAGLVSVTPELNIRVSPRIREAWFNGAAYYRLDNRPLAVIPEQRDYQPDRDRLAWHYRERFQA